MLDAKVQEEYDNRFTEEEKILLKGVGILPSMANKYDKRFNARYIKQLFQKRGILPEQINEYNERFNRPYDVIELAWAKCSPSEAEKYPTKFKGKEVAILFKTGVSAEQAKSYCQRFNGYEISSLVGVGCAANQANRYLDSDELLLDGYVISVLYLLKITPQMINLFNNKKKKRLLNLFRKIAYHPPFNFEKEWNDCSLIGTGAHAAVFLKSDSAFKLSMNIQKEISLLKKLKNSQNVINIKEKLKNGSFSEEDIYRAEIITFKSGDKTTEGKVVLLAEDDQGLYAIVDIHQDKHERVRFEKIESILKYDNKPQFHVELDYIRGNSLENILIQRQHLPAGAVLKYASDIMNGLIELRQAGIWHHRDIRPANIMIDEEHDRAVIIDLGIATINKKAKPKNNRRYGGPNDIVALGQVIYKMVTGEHLFAESKSMERTTYAQKIKDYRDMVYSDKTGKLLEKHLKQIDETVEDEQLKTLIKSCLTAKNYHYKTLQRLFKEFLI